MPCCNHILTELEPVIQDAVERLRFGPLLLDTYSLIGAGLTVLLRHAS
jgi:hypothetical protein